MQKPETEKKHIPVYNIKAVSKLLGLQPVTLRAWERRYGLPAPQRGGQGYRLYSEYDLQTLRWLKKQVDNGLNIGRAVELLTEMRTTGRDPALSSVPASPLSEQLSLDHLSAEFHHAILAFDEAHSNDILRRAFSLYSVDQVLVEVIQPVLVELGEAWHRGETPVAVEHFATQFCMQRLFSMLAASGPPIHPGVILAAGAPGEQHQIGVLILIVMLRWRGWDVRYFGTDLSLERLEEVFRALNPRLLMFSATRIETARRLLGLHPILQAFSNPPIVILGGSGFRAFANNGNAAELPGIFLDAPPTDVIQTIEMMMKSGLPDNNPNV